MDRRPCRAADKHKNPFWPPVSLAAAGLVAVLLLTFACFVPRPTIAFAQSAPQASPSPSPRETPIEAPEQVDVQPQARDDQIRTRLEAILGATGWFADPAVEVQNGVVFLRGQADTAEYKQWAGDLARSTQDVAAVVNQMEVAVPAVWDFQPALAALREQGRSVVRVLPLLLFSLLILGITCGLAWLAANLTGRSLRRRDMNPLLVNVIRRGMSLFVFLLGLYVVFEVAGLTNVALTVLGGTGLLGLILGIAFRDITENFLASIFLSMQNPFRTGDVVEIAGVTGVVQALTSRATILMTLDGNHVQIPNATVYKATIENYTSNPNRRLDFAVGIGFEDAISTAQEAALNVLKDHPAVLHDPQPSVLVESLGSATVNLRVYFWVDGSQYSWPKVKSSVIRLVKGAFQDAGISMPDEARETLFPEGIAVRLVEPDGEKPTEGRLPRPASAAPPTETRALSTDAEAGLSSEAAVIEKQARHARTPEAGENLLKAGEQQGQ
jgi:small conductance mechanosensitive channel